MQRAKTPMALAATVRATDPSRLIARFRQREDGSFIIFGMLLFILMLTFGGIAVDVMRYEQRRTALQQTIDRSVLAAASLTQEREPEGVVNDYFEKAGLAPYLRSVTVTEGLNFRNVNAVADATLPTFFMGMLGYDELEVPAASTAEQRINNVEIVMVLDVSGSMKGTKIVNLKTAAQEFVQTMIGQNPEGRISVSLVPYNGQVNLGPDLISHFDAVYPHGQSGVHCVDLPASVYDNLTISRTLDLPLTAHADTYTSTTQSTSYVAVQGHNTGEVNNWCPNKPQNYVRVMGGDVGTLQAQIGNLEAIGATSINAGLRWGLTLLNPASRDIIDEMIDDGDVSSAFSGRPFDFTDPEAMKVVILMTDGSHFAEERVKNSYKSGNAQIYRSSDGYYSIRHTSNRPSSAGSNQYWVPHRSEWRSTAWNNGVQQTWPQVWARARLTWVAWQLYARALGTSSSSRSTWYNNTMNAFRERTDIDDMDDQLDEICDLAKDQNVIIYGIAFEAPEAGQDVIEDCSTSPAHYFDAQGLEIQSAFRAIASNISQLRLTQ